MISNSFHFEFNGDVTNITYTYRVCEELLPRGHKTVRCKFKL